MKGVIIIGGHVQALGIARILGKLDVTIIILDSTSFNIARHSKFSTLFMKYKKDQLLEKIAKEI